MPDSAGVQFTRESAIQIADAVRRVRDSSRHAHSAGSTSAPSAASHYLCKTASAWAKNTEATLTIYCGTPGSETATNQTLVAWNKFVQLAGDRWVIVARVNGSFYVVAAEC